MKDMIYGSSCTIVDVLNIRCGCVLNIYIIYKLQKINYTIVKVPYIMSFFYLNGVKSIIAKHLTNYSKTSTMLMSKCIIKYTYLF